MNYITCYNYDLNITKTCGKYNKQKVPTIK